MGGRGLDIYRQSNQIESGINFEISDNKNF